MRRHSCGILAISSSRCAAALSCQEDIVLVAAASMYVSGPSDADEDIQLNLEGMIDIYSL